MKQVVELKIKVIKHTILFSLVITALFLLTGYLGFAYGFFYGTLIAIINWLLLARTMEKSTAYSPRQAKFYAMAHYILRFIIIFVAVYIAAMREDMHVVATLLALFVPKATILWEYVIVGFWTKKKENHDKQKT